MRWLFILLIVVVLVALTAADGTGGIYRHDLHVSFTPPTRENRVQDAKDRRMTQVGSDSARPPASEPTRGRQRKR
ncbi:unnamed protein product [Vitrella brassicaformis CCMP3155]|uniref:RxLR effector protein n=1 Tax=Vitrella brassicaformis (strain CCMP3155) TaxID=1169540 RepID=A0A0G4EMF8_VITBC|nr:unnamed protein product [Vitrella brassicaformis CCMP3155]|eukprot:CEL98354.1 unnamed protein product [Vitrella brassicaformis CCMP3155]